VYNHASHTAAHQLAIAQANGGGNGGVAHGNGGVTHGHDGVACGNGVERLLATVGTAVEKPLERLRLDPVIVEISQVVYK
jgi:hypothetical protein